jgi:hypothetical protein
MAAIAATATATATTTPARARASATATASAGACTLEGAANAEPSVLNFPFEFPDAMAVEGFLRLLSIFDKFKLDKSKLRLHVNLQRE